MRKLTIASLMIISFLAVATVIANAQMYSSRGLYSKDSEQDSPLKEQMRQEMNELSTLQYKYEHHQITQDQYYKGMEGSCQKMTDIHREFLSGNVAGILG